MVSVFCRQCWFHYACDIAHISNKTGSLHLVNGKQHLVDSSKCIYCGKGSSVQRPEYSLSTNMSASWLTNSHAWKTAGQSIHGVSSGKYGLSVLAPFTKCGYLPGEGLPSMLFKVNGYGNRITLHLLQLCTLVVDYFSFSGTWFVMISGWLDYCPQSSSLVTQRDLW